MKKYTTYICVAGLMILFALPVQAGGQNRIVVAADGSGDFTSVQEAINSCRAFQTKEQVIYIKNGIYKEKIIIDSFHTHLTLIGESAGNTIITYEDHAGKEGIGTFNSFTIKALGNHTTIENLTIENSSGPVGQAVALHIEGDNCIVRNCNLLGDQDTLYAAGQKSCQYYINCYIEGTTDFIFGAATAVFDNCTLHSKKNSYITASSAPQSKKFGYVFRHCKLTAAPGVTRVYLGRPWRDYAKVVFIACEMGSHIAPEGWHNWNQPEREKTAFYAEYASTGPGGNSSRRVNWSHQLSKRELKKYNLKNIFSYCSDWSIQSEL